MDKVKAGIGVAILVWALFAFYGSYQQTNNEKRLIQECMDDGKKEYECFTMIKGK